MRFAIFFSVAFAIIAAGHAYISWRLSAPYEKRSRIWWRIRICIALLPFIIVASVFVRMAGVEQPITDLAAVVGFMMLGFSSLLFTLLVIRDVFWLLAKLASRGRPVDESRRSMMLSWLNIGGVSGAGLMLGYGALEASDLPRVRVVEIPIPGLSKQLDGFRIAQITDLHVGSSIKRGYVKRVVAAINALEPDIIAVTGDIVDGSVDYLQHDVAPLGDLKSRMGTFMCTGNHEYYSGVGHWIPAFESLGMRVLINRHEVVDVDGARLLVAGVTDIRAGGRVPGHESSPAKAKEGAPPVDLSVLLAHQPRSIHGASEVGFDLQISGHTHGGQFFPWNFFAHLGQPYVSGLHLHDTTWIYVSRGTGFWGPPIRIGAPSELTLLRLVAVPA
jgi:predicted MPP superfamily phosphohydrolase